MAKTDVFRGMTFTVIENEVIRDERVSAHGLLVYMALRHHLNQQTGQCNPGWARIAKVARCSRRQVATAISELEILGYLIRTANPGHSNDYALTPVHQVHTTRAGGAHPPVQVVHTEQYEEEQDEGTISPAAPERKTPAPEYPVGFGQWWEEYPRKISKQLSCERWRAAIKNGATPEELIRAVRNYRERCERNGTEDRFILHPATFLSKGRWEDYLEEEEEQPMSARDIFVS